MQVAVGVGTLAGSTIMLLTTVWGGSLLVGRCDIEGVRETLGFEPLNCPCARHVRQVQQRRVSMPSAEGSSLGRGFCAVRRKSHVLPPPWQGHAVDRKLTRRPLDLINTGVTTDRSTPLNAAIMSATVLLYLIIQVPCAKNRHVCP